MYALGVIASPLLTASIIWKDEYHRTTLLGAGRGEVHRYTLR